MVKPKRPGLTSFSMTSISETLILPLIEQPLMALKTLVVLSRLLPGFEEIEQKVEILNKQLTMESTQQLISQTCDSIRDLLLEKNRKYGDSALNPLRVFSKGSSLDQIKVRIDDKLSRIQNAQGDEDEDPLIDLMGYLVLLKIAMQKENQESVTL